MTVQDPLRVERSEGVALLTIDRQEVMNALNRESLERLSQVLDEVGQDDETRALILTGAGDRAFVAGADIRELQELGPREAVAFARSGQRVLSRLENFDRPVIAAVNGFCLGGGCELALACHLRVASAEARFGQPEVKLGLVPGFGGTQRLTRLIGRGPALEMLLTGEPITADRALELGLVNRLVPSDRLLSEARQLARAILANGPVAVSYCLEAVRSGMDLSLAQGLELESRLFGLCFTSEDSREGTAAFLAKRTPEFRGE